MGFGLDFDEPKIISFQELVGGVDNSYAWLTFTER
jgi:hypothetical protein